MAENTAAKLGVLGASGRTGSQVLKVLPEFSGFELKAALVAPDCPLLGQDCFHPVCGAAIRYSSDLARAAAECESFVDFSTPQSALELVRLCANKRFFIGTTGFSSLELAELKEMGARNVILLAANASFGVYALRRLALEAQRLLGAEFQIEILDLHHALKKDAPSGTALALGADLQKQSAASLALGRQGLRSENQLGIASLRGGDVMGDHTVFFLGRGERLELTHRVTDRAIFARGALKALQALSGKACGFYTLEDLAL